MRTTTLLTTALLLALPLAAVPTANAFAWCVDNVPGHDCWSHTACVGISRDYTTHTERCQYGVGPIDCATVCIRDPCDWLLYCGPGPVLA